MAFFFSFNSTRAWIISWILVTCTNQANLCVLMVMATQGPTVWRALETGLILSNRTTVFHTCLCGLKHANHTSLLRCCSARGINPAQIVCFLFQPWSIQSTQVVEGSTANVCMSWWPFWSGAADAGHLFLMLRPRLLLVQPECELSEEAIVCAT